MRVKTICDILQVEPQSQDQSKKNITEDEEKLLKMIREGDSEMRQHIKNFLGNLQ